MPALRFMVHFPSITGTPEDVVVNTWHFRTPDTLTATMQAVIDQLRARYDAIIGHYPGGISFTTATVKVYNMNTPAPRPPIYEVLLGSTANPTGESGPSEVALALSFHSLRIAGFPPARGRGRIYFGPFDGLTCSHPRPPQTLIDDLHAFGTLLLQASQGATWDWIIWSQAQADQPVGSNFADTTVIGGFVDNSWDNQRRRGIDPTVKKAYGVAAARAGLPTGDTLPAG